MQCNLGPLGHRMAPINTAGSAPSYQRRRPTGKTTPVGTTHFCAYVSLSLSSRACRARESSHGVCPVGHHGAGMARITCRHPVFVHAADHELRGLCSAPTSVFRTSSGVLSHKTGQDGSARAHPASWSLSSASSSSQARPLHKPEDITWPIPITGETCRPSARNTIRGDIMPLTSLTRHARQEPSNK